MMHDFVTTENYAIFFVCPSVFRLENVAQGKPPLAWEPQHGTRIGVMNRKNLEVKWFATDAFYVFHFLNAYEEGNSVVVDFCRMASLDMTGDGPSGQPQAYRFALDMKEGGVKQTQIDEEVNEFPRIDDRLAGFKHRYGYFAASRPTSGFGFTSLDQARLSEEHRRDIFARAEYQSRRAGLRSARAASRASSMDGCCRSGTTATTIAASW